MSRSRHILVASLHYETSSGVTHTAFIISFCAQGHRVEHLPTTGSASYACPGTCRGHTRVPGSPWRPGGRRLRRTGQADVRKILLLANHHFELADHVGLLIASPARRA